LGPQPTFIHKNNICVEMSMGKEHVDYFPISFPDIKKWLNIYSSLHRVEIFTWTDDLFNLMTQFNLHFTRTHSNVGPIWINPFKFKMVWFSRWGNEFIILNPWNHEFRTNDEYNHLDLMIGLFGMVHEPHKPNLS
jgi:hypothetical protein